VQELLLLSLVLAKRMHLPQEEGRDSIREAEDEEEQGRMRVVRLVHSTALLKSRKKMKKKMKKEECRMAGVSIVDSTELQKCLQKKKKEEGRMAGVRVYSKPY
jgi:hypothetical protein